MTRLAIQTLWDGSPARPDEYVHVELDLGQHLSLRVDAPWHGDPPPPGSPGPTDALWVHEVVELFVGGADGSYLEVELSPHGHHLVLILSGIRQVRAELLPLDYQVSRHGPRWIGQARIPTDWLPPAPWTVNAAAIHGQGPGRRYLSAVPLPGERPDFHQPEQWVRYAPAG